MHNQPISQQSMDGNLAQRIQSLESIIMGAISKLEDTKRHFKSNKVREVREELVQALEQK